MGQPSIQFVSSAVRSSINLIRPLPLSRLRPGWVVIAHLILLIGMASDPAFAQCAQTRPCATAPADLGTLGGDWARVLSISGDGSIVVGMSGLVGNLPDHHHAFRWSAAGMVDLTPMQRKTKSEAAGISSDGQTIVGSNQFITGVSATRWTNTGISKIGKANDSYAQGVSSDGSVVVGAAAVGRVWHPFRWSAAGEKDLGNPLGGNWAMAAGASSDGKVIVGSLETAKGTFRAVRWTDAGMVDLGTLGGDLAGANGVSADGTVVVGGSNKTNNGDSHAFLWTSAGMIDLGTLGGGTSVANSVSGDGSVVVGLSQISGSSDYHAFRWTKATGMQDLNTLLANAGINMTGIALLEAVAISGNGEYICGSANFPSKQGRSFIVRFVN